MPLFDPLNPPPDFTQEIVGEMNSLIDRLRAMKRSSIVLAEPPFGIAVPNLVRAYLQAHLRRILTFIEAGVAEVAANRPLAAELATRALYENIATVCAFADNLKPLVAAGDYKAIGALVSNAAFATRIPSFLKRGAEKAPQILDQIDAMDTRYSGFREAYDHLSDIVHPNGLGSVVYFTSRETPGQIDFSDDGANNSAERARISLYSAVTLTAHAELAMIEVEQGLNLLKLAVIVTNLDDSKNPGG